ncbi:linear amide C-N hydrolase [Bacillus paramycoides]|nr:linear amide C-N hydrolase [Bacillus thuringiensis]MBO1129167.1 linear amide C-N hydrolase [Bacillus cereus]QQP82381.1 linear amide C-N hydrolase [Bacillus sp. TK-2]MBY0017636.1 linear amide C-N hydrolase [Bacillus cereus]TKH52934.1 linear amide C-N hydrolase [Bacillus cereus]
MKSYAQFSEIYWLFFWFRKTQFKSVEELKKFVASISFWEVPLPALGVTPPLHWILSDKWGESIVLESTRSSD